MSGGQAGAVVIGASAGALEALNFILPALDAGFPWPIFVIVHLPPDKRSVLAEIFDAKCALRVIEAEDKEPVRAGTVYVSPPDYHMLIEDQETIALSNEDAVLFSRPSIDVSFESAADVFADRLVGIVLTGANQDGAKGLQAIVRAGGVAIVQDPQGAYARAMPEAALAACPEACVLPLPQIASHLSSLAT
ncbi:chemotaxis protein CheB [Rhizobium sp. YIM 134829]|uniref:chemotaxis protein CheB n=1 Tax=Rhizobium sp. YIM 134829 TaxID=3390453 RepID=UPI00397E11F3